MLSPADPHPKPVHPLTFALRGLVRDFLSTLAFLAVFEITGRLAIAIAWGIAFGVGQIAYGLAKHKQIDRMQWLSLFLVGAFGGVSLLTGNFLLYRIKFSVIYAVIGITTLPPGWMNVYVPPAVREKAADITKTFGFVWSGLFFSTAALNFALATLAKPSIWAWFIGVFPIASKALLACAQYFATRRIIRQRAAI